MDGLAHEIKLRIIEEILHDLDSSETTVRGSLKALSRTCQAWSDLPLPHLFARLRVPLWGPSGLQRLYSISQSPRTAKHVEELVFDINFDIANPHPAPFTRSNQKRASGGFWQQHDEPKESRFKRMLPLKGSRQRSSLAKDIARLSLSSRIPRIDDLFTQLDGSARATITNNLGREKYAAIEGLPPLLTQLASILSDVFSSMKNLHTLRLSTQLQTDFIASFTHGHALQFSPVFGTFSSISDLITTTILLGWIRSSLFLSTLSIEAGSPFALSRFLQEFVPRVAATANEADSKTCSPLPLSALTSKLGHLRSLSILYDEGHIHPSDNDILQRIARRNVEWKGALATILAMTISLKTLHIGRAQQPIYAETPPVLFTLDCRSLSRNTSPNSLATNTFPFELETLSIRGFRSRFDELLNLLMTLDARTVCDTGISLPPLDSRNGLKRLRLGGMRLVGGTWRDLFLRIRLRLRSLESFELSVGDYVDVAGRWECREVHDSAVVLGSEDSRTMFRQRLCRWVEGRRDHLGSLEEAWESDSCFIAMGDASMRYVTT